MYYQAQQITINRKEKYRIEYKIQESEQQKDKIKIDAIDILLGIKNYNDKNLTND